MVSTVAVGGTLGRASLRARTRLKTAWPSWWPLFVVGGLLCLPLCATCVWLYFDDGWSPFFDLALIEMRVRDVGTWHTPLLGLPGRLGRFPEVASHPGPIGFYLLAPIYRLLGGSYWALRVSTLACNIAAILIALLIAKRRAGTFGVIATGLILGSIEVGFGMLVISEAWNPNLPVLWFTPFLLAIWSVVDGDVKLLPAAAALGTLSAQTHIPYLAVCGGLSILAFALVFARWFVARRRKLPRRGLASACFWAVAVALVLWSPPILEQLIHKRGNLTILFEYFTNPPEALVGFRGAKTVLLEHFDTWLMLGRVLEHPGIIRTPFGGSPSPVHGAIVLGLWFACAAVALCVRERKLVTLHVTVAAALLVGLVSISRIIGAPWVYVVFFVWSIHGLAVLAILATIGHLLTRFDVFDSEPWRAAAGAIGIGFIAVYCAVLMSTVAKTGSTVPAPSSQIAALGRDAANAILRVARSKDAQPKYVVTWEDALWSCGAGLGLMMELERHGIQVFLPTNYAYMTGPHRTIAPERATARIHYANAGWISDAAHVPGSVQLAYSDLRKRALRKEYDTIHDALLADMSKAGRLDAAPSLERDVGALPVPQLGPYALTNVQRLAEIGAPGAVFLLPSY